MTSLFRPLPPQGRLVRRLALTLLVPLAVASCGEAAPLPAKTAPKAAASSTPEAPQALGMNDTLSSLRPGDQPDATRTGMNAKAATLYAQALASFQNGDMLAARTQFQEVTQADPHAYQGFYSLGVVQERLHDAGAGASYRQAFTVVPDYEPAIIAYAMLLAKKNQLSDAERTLTEKRAQMPKSAALAATLAEIKSLEKDTGSAQRIAQEALKLNPDYRPAMVIIARDHFRNRRLDLALYALQAILDGFGEGNPPRDKDNPEALLLRALIYREQGNRAGAMEEFRKAAEKRPDLVEAAVQLSTYLLEAGNAEEAQPILERAVRFDSESVPAHLNLADTYRLLGRYGDAKREFEWVLAKNATLPQVHYDLGLLYLFAPSVPGMTPKQQMAEAIKELKKFQEIRPKDERDDSDELLNRAKLKDGELTAAATPPPPMPSAAPSASPSTAPSATPAAAPSGAPSAAPAASSAAPHTPPVPPPTPSAAPAPSGAPAAPPAGDGGAPPPDLPG